MAEESGKVLRRDFLKLAAGTLAGAAGLISASQVCGAASSEERPGLCPDAGDRPWAMIIDVSRCMGCQSCVTACKYAKDTGDGQFLLKVERRLAERDSGPAPVFVTASCIHCQEAPCIPACTHGAVKRLAGGIVVTDLKRCTSDGSCLSACPFGARVLDPRVDGRAVGCDLCLDLTHDGLLPACVQACPSRARIFGDFSQPEGEFAEYLKAFKLLRPDGSPSRPGDRVMYAGL